MYETRLKAVRVALEVEMALLRRFMRNLRVVSSSSRLSDLGSWFACLFINRETKLLAFINCLLCSSVAVRLRLDSWSTRGELLCKSKSEGSDFSKPKVVPYSCLGAAVVNRQNNEAKRSRKQDHYTWKRDKQRGKCKMGKRNERRQ